MAIGSMCSNESILQEETLALQSFYPLGHECEVGVTS